MTLPKSCPPAGGEFGMLPACRQAGEPTELTALIFFRSFAMSFFSIADAKIDVFFSFPKLFEKIIIFLPR